MASDDSGSSFAVGFLAGGIVGVMIGIMIAPRAGSEMRTNLMEQSGPTVESVRERVAPTVESVRERVAPVVDQVRTRVRRGGNSGAGDPSADGEHETAAES